MLNFEDFLQLAKELQSPTSDQSYQSQTILVDFTHHHFETFQTYFLQVLDDTEIPLHTKKIVLILFNSLFRNENDEISINPNCVQLIVKSLLSMFQYNDIELVRLSANLIASFFLIQQSDDDGIEKFISVCINSLSSVTTPSEIYGFAIIIFELCSRFPLQLQLQQSVFEICHNFLNSQIDSFIKIKFIQIFETQIQSPLPIQFLTSILERCFTLFSDINLHNELFLCYSQIIFRFPKTTEMIFKNIVPFAIQSLPNSLERQSILFFFSSSISQSTIEYYQEVIPILLPILVSISDTEINHFTSDTSELIEELFSVYQNNPIELLQSLNIQSNYIYLLAFYEIAQTLGKNYVDFNFLKAMITSPNQKEKYMAIRCVNVLTQQEFIEELIILVVQNFADPNVAIQCELIDLLSTLSLYKNFPIEMYFGPLFTFFLGEDPYLGEGALNTLRKIIKQKAVTIEKLVLLVNTLLKCFNESLQNVSSFDFLPYFSSLIQSLAFRLNDQFLPFADSSYECLIKMSQISLPLLLDSFPPIAAIAKCTKDFPFLEDYMNNVLQVLSQNEDVDLLKQIIDVVVNSVSSLLSTFDLSFKAPQLFEKYLLLFHQKKFIQIISGFYDLLNAFPQLFNIYGEQLIDLLSISAQELQVEIQNQSSTNINYIDLNDNEEEGEEEDGLIDDDDDVLTMFVDLFDLSEFIFRIDQTNISHKMIEFVLQMIVFSQHWFRDFEVRKSLLLLILRLSMICPDLIIKIIQSNVKIKDMILFGLNSQNLNPISQQIINIFGYDSF